MRLTGWEAAILGWVAGVATPLLVEFLRRRLWDRGALKIEATFSAYNLDDGPGDITLSVHLVNTSDVPVILTRATYSIEYGKRSICVWEPDMGGRRDYEFPLRLGRHEEYFQSVDASSLISDYIDGCVEFDDPLSELDLERISIHAAFSDTTGKHWRTREFSLAGMELDGVIRHLSPEAPLPRLLSNTRIQQTAARER